ncbi:phage tail tape measure protein, partial [Trabulsiella guamensis ATCC 49490]
MTSLNIRVAFSATDKLTRPINAARQSVGSLSESIQKTQSAIKDLDSQAKGFNRLRDSVQKTSRKIDETSRTLEGLNKAQRDGVQLTDKQREHMTALAAKLERLNTTRTKEMEKLRDASQALRGHGVSLAGSDRTTESAIRRTEQYNQALERERRQLATVTQAQARYSRMKEAGDKLQSTGMKTMAGGAAVFAPVVAAVKSYSNLEDAMKGVSKQVNGLRDDDGNRTSRYTEMQGAIKNASEELPMPRGAVDYAALVEGGARMGVADSNDPWQKQKQDLLSFATTAAMASKAFELPADQLAESMGRIAGLYKIPVRDIASLGDVINYLDDNAKSKGSDIIDVLQRVGGAAEQLGYQNAAAIGSTFLTLGEESSRASNALTAMVRELSTATVQPDRFLEGLNSLGLSAEKIQKNMAKDAMGTIMTVLEATKKLDDSQQMSALTRIFGDDYATAIAKLTNNLPELRRQLELTRTTASRGSMKRESDIDKDSISSQWLITTAALGNNFSALGESLRVPAMEIMTSLTGVLQKLREWIETNPELVASIMKFIAVGGTILTVLGAVMLATGMLLGPLGKLQLGFSLLGSGGGIGRAITLFGAFRNVSGGALTGIRGWGSVFTALSGGLGRLGGLLAPVRGMLLSVFISPLSAVSSLGRVIGGLVLRLSGLPAVWSMITTGVSMLGGVLSFLLSPVGLVVAALVGGAFLIWKYWDQITAFLSGYFARIMEKLAPIRESFSRFSPLFDAIGEAISRVWNWFKELLSPM